MTEILILYILIKYDATIYKIKKLIEEKFFMYASPSLGAINPALKKLEELSCVEFESKMSDRGMLSKTVGMKRHAPFCSLQSANLWLMLPRVTRAERHSLPRPER